MTIVYITEFDPVVPNKWVGRVIGYVQLALGDPVFVRPLRQLGCPVSAGRLLCALHDFRILALLGTTRAEFKWSGDRFGGM